VLLRGHVRLLLHMSTPTPPLPANRRKSTGQGADAVALAKCDDILTHILVDTALGYVLV
jgi:hypothetical protein